MSCLIIVGPLITGRRESEVKIRIPTYSNSITSVHQGAGRIEGYNVSAILQQLNNENAARSNDIETKFLKMANLVIAPYL